MISKLTYTIRDAKPGYRLERDDTEIFSAELSLSFAGIKADITKKGARYCSLDFEHNKYTQQLKALNDPKTVMKTVVYDLVGRNVGGMTLEKKDKYTYFKCKIGDYEFSAYAVVYEKEVLRIAIKTEDTQVAVIEDQGTQPADGYVYTITSKDELSAEMAAIFAVYFDINVYKPFGEFSYSPRRRHFEITENDALRRQNQLDFALAIENTNFISDIDHKAIRMRTLELDTKEIEKSIYNQTVQYAKEHEEDPHEEEPQPSEPTAKDIVESTDD